MSFKDLVGNLLEVAIPTFGEVVEYRPQTGGRYSLRAVLDRSFAQLDPETQIPVSINQPRLGIKLSDIAGEPRQGDTVRVNQESFRVNEIQEDGQGGAYLLLTRLDA